MVKWHARYQQPDVKEKAKEITKESRGNAGDGFLRVLHLPVSHTEDSTVVDVGIPQNRPPDGPEP